MRILKEGIFLVGPGTLPAQRKKEEPKKKEQQQMTAAHRKKISELRRKVAESNERNLSRLWYRPEGNVEIKIKQYVGERLEMIKKG